jgi:hypothetical protein
VSISLSVTSLSGDRMKAGIMVAGRKGRMKAN